MFYTRFCIILRMRMGDSVCVCVRTHVLTYMYIHGIYILSYRVPVYLHANLRLPRVWYKHMSLPPLIGKLI